MRNLPLNHLTAHRETLRVIFNASMEISGRERARHGGMKPDCHVVVVAVIIGETRVDAHESKMVRSCIFKQC